VKRAFLLLLFAAAAVAQTDQISGESIRAHVKYLPAICSKAAEWERAEAIWRPSTSPRNSHCSALPAGDTARLFQGLTL
jgi:hypothetical protein